MRRLARFRKDSLVTKITKCSPHTSVPNPEDARRRAIGDHQHWQALRGDHPQDHTGRSPQSSREILAGPRQAVRQLDALIEETPPESSRAGRRKKAGAPLSIAHLAKTAFMLRLLTTGGSEARAAFHSSKGREAGDRLHSPNPPARAEAKSTQRTLEPACGLPSCTSPAGALEQGNRSRLVKRSTAASGPEFVAAKHVLKRSIEDVPDLNGDLRVSASSLIGARVKAVRLLSGQEAEGKEDEQLLDIANQIHRDARNTRHDHAVRDASLALYKAEAEIWAAENGGDEIILSREQQLDIYQEAWDLALEPPSTPEFKTRPEVWREKVAKGKEALAGFNFQERMRSFRNDLTLHRIGAGAYLYDEAVRQYYKQFSDYIDKNLSKIAKIKAAANAEQAGLKRMVMEYRPSTAWAIQDVTIQRAFNWPHVWLQKPVKHLTMPAIVVALPEKKFGYISPTGEFQFLDKSAFHRDGSLKNDAVLRLLDIDFDDTASSVQSGLGCPAQTKRCPLSYFKVKTEFVSSNENPASIKEIMEGKIRKNVIAAIEQWKKDNYDPPVLESILRIVVPFYETIHKELYDPKYDASFEDIAWDLLDLGLTLIPIGGSAIKSGRTGMKAAKAAVAATKGTAKAQKASIALRAFMDGFKTSSFLAAAGRELTDFVVPIFTARNVLRATGRGAAEIARNRLKTLLKADVPGAAAAVRKTGAVADPQDILERVYKDVGENRLNGNFDSQRIRRILDDGATRPIGNFVYRGQVGGHIQISDRYVGADNRDRLLAAIIEHVSRHGGSIGEIRSLTSSATFARHIAEKRGGQVWRISTVNDRKNFRTIESILRDEGPRLVQRGLLKERTLGAAITTTLNHQHERELFYLGGHIPEEWVSEVGRPTPHRPAAAATGLSGPDAAVESIADFLARPRNWSAEAGDYAPKAIANALGRELVLRDFPVRGKSWRVEPRRRVSGPPIEIAYRPGHYDAYLGGRLHTIPGDGDCLFRAVLTSMRQERDIADDAVNELRKLAAQDVRNNHGDYVPFVGAP